jgi:hypothetical protein
MENPGNIQVWFASLEPDARIGFEAVRVPPKGRAGYRQVRLPSSNPLQLDGFS